MNNKYKTKNELMQELAEMSRKVKEVETCRIEFQKAREKYEKLLDSAPDAMVFINGDSRIVMTNAQFDTLFGYPHGDVDGRNLDILIPERYREKHHALVAEFLRNPKVRPMGSGFEVYARKSNGDEIPVDISLSLLQTEEELLVSAAVRDITKRREAEAQVEMNYIIQRVLNSMLKISLEPIELEKQFDKILDLILTVPHLSLQSKGAIYLREDSSDVLVMKAQRGFPETSLYPCRTVPFGKCLCGKAASLSEMVYSNHLDGHHEIHNEGDFPHGHYCVPILSGNEVTGLLNVYLNEGHKRSGGEEAFLSSVASTLAGIIKHDRTEHEKQHLQSRLAQAEKLAALGRFTANVAHEIRNPLTAVGGFARRLEKSIPGDSKEKEYAGYIISEVSRLEGILKNVLTFSHDVSPRLDESDVHDVIERVLEMHKDIFRGKSVSVAKSFCDLPQVLIDDTQFHEALENLILNAVDAMPEGGVLTVTTDREDHNGAPYIKLRVSDTGIGIAQDKLDLIFEPFYTTKVAEKGTGLGLPITRKVVEDHGGFMKVESTPGKGTAFSLYFPYRVKAR